MAELLVTAPLRWQNTLLVSTPGSLGWDGRRKKRKHFQKLFNSTDLAFNSTDLVFNSTELVFNSADSVPVDNCKTVCTATSRQLCQKLLNWFNLKSTFINVFVHFNDVFLTSFFLRQTAVCCSRWSPTKRLCSVTRTVQGKLSGWKEKTDYFDPLTYFCLNEMWGTDNRGKKDQFSTDA